MVRPGIAALMFALALAATAAVPEGNQRAGETDAETLSLDETLTLAEMQTLAGALEECAVYTGWYVALEALNDDSVLFPSRPYDYINNGGGSYAIKPAEGRFRANRVNFLTGFLQWTGPYVTFQAGRWQTGSTPYDQGSPLDLWGTPYYFFTPYGLARGDSGTITQELYGDSFAQYTIVSLGPDGVMSNDDLAYSFGAAVSGFMLTSLRGAGVQAAYAPGSTAWSAPAGTTLTLHGHNLGTAPADGKAFFNTTEVPWTSWTNQAIEVMLPARLAGQTGTLTVKRGTLTSSALNVTVTASRNAAQGWRRYE